MEDGVPSSRERVAAPQTLLTRGFSPASAAASLRVLPAGAPHWEGAAWSQQSPQMTRGPNPNVHGPIPSAKSFIYLFVSFLPCDITKIGTWASLW